MTRFFLTLPLLFILASCSATPGAKPANESAPEAPITITTPSRVSLVITPGQSYDSVIHLLFFTIRRPATFACWLETAEGSYVDTLYASHNAAKEEWYAHPKGQPGALPVWTHAAAAGRSDAVSGATPKSGTTLVVSGKAAYPAGTYRVRFEINRAHDTNAAYPSGDNGQPSIVYEGSIELGKGSQAVALKIAGTGAVDGRDGALHGLDGLTSALYQIAGVEARYLE